MNRHSLQSWLSYIEELHPAECVLGLERIDTVWQRLQLHCEDFKVVKIAGTNGKGSCVAALEAMALAEGVAVASYTSPHLLHFCERLRFNGQQLGEQQWCCAFEVVETARTASPVTIPLTFFEFVTLAALWQISRQGVELALLEIGLGGRLDAVNIAPADVAVVTSVALDHEALLGTDRETIGAEKAAVFVGADSAVYADREPLRSVVEAAGDRGLGLGKEFLCSQSQDGHWHWQGCLRDGTRRSHSALAPPKLHEDSIAAAVQAWYCLFDQLGDSGWQAAVDVTLQGRRQQFSFNGKPLIVDVAHNPASAAALADFLASIQGPQSLRVVCGMLRDKDAAGFGRQLASRVRCWYPATPASPRGLPAQRLAQELGHSGVPVAAPVQSVITALHKAEADLAKGEAILVCGSFFTVAEVLNFISSMSGLEVA